MASKKDIEAGKAFVTLYVKNSMFVKSLRDAESQLKAMGSNIASVGKSLMGAGMALAAPLAASVASFVSTGDALDKMAQRTHTSVEALSELGAAAKQSGANLGQIESAITSMNSVFAGANRAEAGAADSLARLGLVASDLRGKLPDQQFELLAERIANVRDPSERAARAVAVFGGAGQQLLPMLSQGAKGIQQLRQQAQDAGATFSTSGAKAAAALKASYESLKTSARGVMNAVGEALAPDLIEVARAATQVASAIVSWVRANKDVVVTIAKVAGGLIAAGAAITLAGGLVSTLGAAFGSLATLAVGAVSAVASVFALLTSPAILATAAIVGVGLAVAKWGGKFDAAKQAAGSLFGTLQGWASSAMSWFADLGDDFAATWQGIKDAIAAGDLSLAAEVAFAGVKLVFTRVVAVFQQAWQGAKAFFLETWSGITEVIAGGFLDGFAAIQSGWVNVTSFFASTWASVVGTLKQTFYSFVQQIMPMLESIVKAYGYFAGKTADEIDEMIQRGRNNATNWRQQAGDTAAKATAAIEADRQKRIDAIEAERIGAREQLRQMGDAERNAINQQAADAIKAAQDDVDKAKAALSASTGKASKAAAQTRQQAAGGLQMAGPDTTSERIAATAGTFAATGAMMLGGGGSNMERIARESLKTQKELKKEMAETRAFMKKLGLLLVVK